MLRKIKYLLLAFTAALLLVTNAQAETVTLEFTNIWLDDHDSLIIDDSSQTLQWHYFGSWTAVGWNDNTQIPMHVKITDTGSFFTDLEQDWTIWTTKPVTEAYSPTLAIPDLPLEYMQGAPVFEWTGRDKSGTHITNFVYASPKMTIEFFDDILDSTKYPGADWYTAKVTFDYNPPSGVVPIPAAAWLLGSGLIGLVAVRRRLGGK